jgi:hypothetical protein
MYNWNEHGLQIHAIRVRASMIYLSLGINLEEKKKIISHPALPIDFIELKDELKH